MSIGFMIFILLHFIRDLPVKEQAVPHQSVTKCAMAAIIDYPNNRHVGLAEVFDICFLFPCCWRS